MRLFRRRRDDGNGRTTARLDLAERVARDHSRRLLRLEAEVGILRPPPKLKRTAQ